MLTIDIPEFEVYDEKNNRFISIKACSISLEHSLISISKWEQKWKKPFLSKLEKHKKTDDELLDYIRCMCLTKNVDPLLFKHLPGEAIQKINEYIEDPMTATWFNKREDNTNSREIVTSELIYYWMIKMNIPTEFQKWHLNRLMTLIEIFAIKDSPPKKMSASEIAKRRTALNAARLKQYNTRG